MFIVLEDRKEDAFLFEKLKKRNERNDGEALVSVSLAFALYTVTILTFAAMISRVSEIFLCGFRFISLYFILTRFFPRTSRASKNLASSLFAFLSRRRSAMDRNKRRIPFEESSTAKRRFCVFYFIGIHAEADIARDESE